jgi:hypothetical protein
MPRAGVMPQPLKEDKHLQGMMSGAAGAWEPTPSSKEHKRSAAAAQGWRSTFDVGSYTAAGLDPVAKLQTTVQIEKLRQWSKFLATAISI